VGGRSFERSAGGRKGTRAPATGAVGYRGTPDRQVHNMASRSTANSIDEYIAGFPLETQKVLEGLRALIKTSAPDATETISYAIPTFDLNGHLVHFAGYEKHIGFYPTGSGVEAFKEELKPDKSGKGSVQLPLGQPMPRDLIRRIVEFRVKENTGKASKLGRRAAAEAERGREMGLDKGDHRSLALWAADCAEHVLPYFEEKYPKDDRPRKAVEAGRAWVRGEIECGEARAAAVAAHAAARDADQAAARAAARAAGHAAATAHVAGHAAHAATYAVTAVTCAAVPTDAAAATTKERDWQYRHLPKHLRPVAFPAQAHRAERQ